MDRNIVQNAIEFSKNKEFMTYNIKKSKYFYFQVRWDGYQKFKKNQDYILE